MINKRKVTVFILLGALFSFIREIIIVHYLGDSYESDIFRVSYSLPNFFLQTIGTLFVTFSMGVLCDKSPDKQESFYKQSIFILALLTSILIITTPYQLRMLYPGFSLNDDVVTLARISWLIFLVGGGTLIPRAYLNLQNDRFSASTTQLVRAITFCSVIVLLSNFQYTINAKNLIFASIFSVFCLVFTHASGIKSLLTKLSYWDFKLSTEWKHFFGVVLLYQLLVSSSRFIDRSIASSQSGLMSVVEFSYGMYTIPLSIFLSVFSIIVIPKVLSRNDGLRIKKYSILVISLIIPLSSIAIYYMYGFVFDFFIVYLKSFSKNGSEILFDVSRAMFSMIPLCLISLLSSHYFLAKKRFKLLLFISSIKLVSKIISVFMCLYILNIGNIETIIYSFIFSELTLCVVILFFYIRGDYCVNHSCRNA
ncbi:hypothetical protein [Vibrio sp. 1S139]|uniref:hypothetical protein n=1 Tax=Vibrio sp. 1S139 TaxID=3230006 RepID=UPI00352F85E4